MPETPEKALERLLKELFDADEFRVFLRGLEAGDKLETALAGKVATTELLFSEAVRALKRRGEIDERFFDAMVEERPKRAQRVGDVRERWIGSTLSKGHRDAHAVKGDIELYWSSVNLTVD